MDPKALYNITYGLYLLSARENGKDNGCIINTAVQIAENPVRIGVSVSKRNLTHDMVLRTGHFNVSTLCTDTPFDVFKRFGMQSGRDADKFSGFDGVQRAENGLLRLTDYTNAYFAAKVVSAVDLGTHTFFIGEVTEERLDTLRAADAIAREELTAAGLDGEIWQCPVVLLADVRSVGVQGDGRTYGHPIVLRPVTSEDAMTADWSRIPYDVLERISTRITNEVKDVNRVVLDVTSKPPGTIEWE